jgi:hypothetical protein
MKTLILISFLTIVTSVNGQDGYPFERFPSIEYKEYKDWKTYDKLDKEKKIHFTLTIPKYFDNEDSLTIQLTAFQTSWDSSYVRIFRNKKQIQKMFEPMHFLEINVQYESVRIADINGDKLNDIKIIIPYMGNGLASLNQRIIYLFQKDNGLFDKVSYLDKMGDNRAERDFDGDGQYEIITMTLKGHEGHNYWTFNLYNFINGELMTQNSKFDYPIMIQYLFRDNYKITDKISTSKMKSFGDNKPEEYYKD